jgi:mRNA interferase MazF
VVWVDFSPTRGREQKGARPALVVSSADYLASVPDLIIVLPITSVDRRMPHHVDLWGAGLKLTTPSFAMTEQPRTVSRERAGGDEGCIDPRVIADVDSWLRFFMGL